METENHQNATQSGLEEHSGVHVCHKCGWPFPNSQPSSRHRKAHKKVCGTIEGYKLDSSQDKTHVEGSDNDHVSDDNHKILSDKVIERTISRKSSSGFGSRSSRSTRSEDEVFADAVTDFGEASDGISRGNSLQYTAESGPEGSELDVENAIDDDSSATSIVLEDKQLWTVQTFEGKNDEVKAEIPSQDQSSISNPALICASVTRENENAVEHNLMQSSGTSEGLDTNDDECKEIAKNDNLSGPKTPNTETADASEQVSGLDDRDECPHRVDSPGNSNPFSNLIQEVDSPDGNPSKSLDMAVEHEPKIEANENADVLDIPNAFPLQEDREIAFEDLDHEGGKFNISMALEAPSEIGSMEDMLKQEDRQKEPVVEQETVGGLDEISDLKASYGGLQSEEALEDIRDEVWEDQEVSDSENQRSIVSSEKVFPEVTTTDSVRDQGTSTNGHSNAIDAVTDDGESLDTLENNSSKVPVGEWSVTSSSLAECCVDDAPQDEKLMNGIDSDVVGNAQMVRVNEFTVGVSEVDQEVSSSKEQKSIVSLEKVFPEGVTTDGVHDQETSTYGGAKAIDVVKDDGEYVVTRENESNKVDEMTVEVEDENALVSAETMESSEDDDEPIKSAGTHDHSELYKVLDSGNLMVGHSQQESGLTPQGVLREAENAGKIIVGEECPDKVDTGDVVKTNDCFDSSLKMSEFGGSFGPSSTTVLGSCSENFAEPASDVTESDRITNQHIAISPAVDVIHWSELTDSQESNSQSFSVPSATLDAFPVTNNDASSSSQVEPIAMEEVQYRAGKTDVEPLGFEKSEFTSEIEASENQKQAALKTLLGEAIAKSRAESPNYDEVSAKNPKAKETAKEWDSPARYPVKIKTEKKRAKSRYWVPFLCCSSSVNANGP